MANPQSKAPNWIPYLGLILAVVSVVYNSGQLTSRVASNENRITKLEAINTQLTQAINQVTLQGVKNETKLDFLVQQAKDDAERKRR